MLHAPHPTHRCKSITIAYLGMSDLLNLFDSDPGASMANRAAGQPFIKGRDQVIVVPPSGQFSEFLCRNPSVNPVALTVTLCHGSRPHPFPELCRALNRAGRRDE